MRRRICKQTNILTNETVHGIMYTTTTCQLHDTASKALQRARLPDAARRFGRPGRVPRRRKAGCKSVIESIFTANQEQAVPGGGVSDAHMRGGPEGGKKPLSGPETHISTSDDAKS